jgi:hypothetical protein
VSLLYKEYLYWDLNYETVSVCSESGEVFICYSDNDPVKEYSKPMIETIYKKFKK